jgi:hypothetical protein
MSHSTTLLDLLSVSQAQKEATANSVLDAASPATLFGRRASTTVLLTWGYYGGNVWLNGVNTAVANGTVALTASTTNYVEATRAGVVSANTTGFTQGRIPLYTVVTGSSTVTSYTDHRTYAVFGESVVSLTDGASIAVDASKGSIFKVTLGGNRTLANPTNLTEGMRLKFLLTQDGTGSRTLAYGSNYKFPAGSAPVLTTTAGAKDMMDCYYDGTVLLCQTVKAFA